MSGFKIRCVDEETTCASQDCDWPLYVGDLAWESDEGNVYCGRSCAGEELHGAE